MWPLELLIDVEVLLAATTDEWVSQIFHRALEDEDLVKVRLSAGQKKHVSKNAWLQLGSPREMITGVDIPIRIQGTRLPSLFPTLEGEIELAPMGDELTQITLRGNYKPPLAAVGRVGNKVLLHRVAEASIKRFLDDLATSLESARTPA